MPRENALPSLQSKPPTIGSAKPLIILSVGSRSHPRATNRTIVNKPRDLQQPAPNLHPSHFVAEAVQSRLNEPKPALQRLPLVDNRIDLDEPGYLRLPQVLKLLAISRSGFYKGIQDGIYPQQVKLSPASNARAVGWPKIAIKQLLDDLASQA